MLVSHRIVDTMVDGLGIILVVPHLRSHSTLDDVPNLDPKTVARGIIGPDVRSFEFPIRKVISYGHARILYGPKRPWEQHSKSGARSRCAVAVIYLSSI